MSGEARLRRGRPPREAALLVVADVARTHGVTVEEILGRGRTPAIAAARHAAYAAVKAAFPESSLPGLGAFFGRDHTSIMVGLRRAAGEGPEEAKGRVRRVPSAGLGPEDAR